MNAVLLKKCITEARLLFAGLGLLLFVFCWLRVFIVSRLQTSQFAAIVEQLWDQLKDFWPVPLDQLLTYTGRIAVGYNEPVVVFGVSIFAIARVAGWLAHWLEQLKNNRIFRPEQVYVGKQDVPYVPLEKRP